MYSRNLASEQMILVEGEGRKEGSLSFLLPSSLPSSLHPSIHRSAPTNDRVALKTNNLETIVALKRLSRSSPPSLSFSHCSCIYPLFSEKQNGTASEQACGQRTSAARRISFSIIRRNRRKEGGRERGEKDGVRIMWWEDGRRERERASCGETKITPLSIHPSGFSLLPLFPPLALARSARKIGLGGWR